MVGEGEEDGKRVSWMYWHLIGMALYLRCLFGNDRLIHLASPGVFILYSVC